MISLRNKILLFFIYLSFFNNINDFYCQEYLTEVRDSSDIWLVDYTLNKTSSFGNLFTFKDSLYCTYGKNTYESFLCVRRDTSKSNNWFPITNISILKVLVQDDSVEAWCTDNYKKTKNLFDWKPLPNPHSDLSWSAVKWNNYSVWGLEEYGRSGVVYIQGDSIEFEEIEPEVDVYSLAKDDENFLYAGLKNNRIYRRSKDSKWYLYKELPQDGSHLRLIKFVNDKEYFGTNILRVNNQIILDCMPSDLIYFNDYYYLTSYDKGIFISKDGTNFIKWNEGLINLNVRSICVYKNELYVATSTAIYKRSIPNY